MPQYPASSFEAAIGGFLGGYSTVADIRDRRAEAARAGRAARQAEQMRAIQMAESGYQEVDFTVPTVEPRRNFIQSIGHRLRGSPEPERDLRMLKIGPSAAERAAAQNREFQIADREDTQAHAAGLASEQRTFTSGENTAERAARAAEAERSRQTQMGVANIHAGASRRADERARAESDREQRDQFLNELAAATGGDARKMRGIVEARPDLMAKARRWKIPGFAYSAVAEDYRQRRELSDATTDAKKRTGESYLDTKRRLEREAQSGAAGGTSGVARQQEAWDRAAAALRAQGKDPATVIGRRP